MGIAPQEMAPARSRAPPSASRAPVIDLTGDESPPRKRKSSAFEGRESTSRRDAGASQQRALPQKRCSNAMKEEQSATSWDAGAPQKKARKSKDEEKRLKRWRTHAPQTYQEVRDRALTQRMFVLDRQRASHHPDHPTENISLAGTTGNVYTITVDKVPSCDCPHARKGNHCKHIAYVMNRVLRAPAHLEYQQAFLSAELREIFAAAPPLPSEAAEGAQDGKRKPIDGEECPICCEDFASGAREAVVYCKAACGQNIHKSCFGQWAATKSAATVTCPFCRAPWEGDQGAVGKVIPGGQRNQEGYVNVAGQLGITGRRDHSSYHSYWVHRQLRDGELGWDDDGVMAHDGYRR